MTLLGVIDTFGVRHLAYDDALATLCLRPVSEMTAGQTADRCPPCLLARARVAAAEADRRLAVILARLGRAALAANLTGDQALAAIYQANDRRLGEAA